MFLYRRQTLLLYDLRSNKQSTHETLKREIQILNVLIVPYSNITDTDN